MLKFVRDLVFADSWAPLLRTILLVIVISGAAIVLHTYGLGLPAELASEAPAPLVASVSEAPPG